MNRRGMTLVEVLITLTITAGIVVLSMTLLADIARQARGRLERAGAAETLRTVAAVLDRELWSVGWDSLGGSDVDSLGSTGVVTRAMRATGLACRLAPDTVEVASDSSRWFAERQPVPGRDSLLLYLEGDSTAMVNAWLPLPIVAVGAGTCPDGAPSLLLSTSLPPSTITRWRAAAPTPVRTFEVMAFESYSSGAALVFGARGVSSGAVVQPVAGPLAASGLALEYWGTGGAPVLRPDQVREMSGWVRAIPDAELAVGFGRAAAAPPDSLFFRVRLRNVP
ncbi:MAG: prepilin-type N-terminal cleavage/methylation domain-containing protein [Gemmatimonadota bacterium]